MKFENVDLLPGVIIDVNDPLLLGRVKAFVPTLFDTETMETEALPWIHEWKVSGNQTHSTLDNGSKIWVFKTQNNYSEFWYMPMSDKNETLNQILQEDYLHTDVLVCRNGDNNNTLIFSNLTTGIMLCIGEKTKINIKPDSTIDIEANNAKINLKEDKVYLGDGSASNHVMMGEPLQQALSTLASGLQQVSSAFTPNEAGAKTALLQVATQFKSNIAENLILCKNTLAD